NELKQLRAAYPERSIDLEVSGDTRGVWDGLRVQQVLCNLVLNAIKYGTPDAAIRVELTGEADTVRFDVKNRGVPIDPLVLDQIFEPLKRGPQSELQHDGQDGLGLGLFIAREIAVAHGGGIEARSDAAETVFT